MNFPIPNGSAVGNAVLGIALEMYSWFFLKIALIKIPPVNFLVKQENIIPEISWDLQLLSDISGNVFKNNSLKSHNSKLHQPK